MSFLADRCYFSYTPFLAAHSERITEHPLPLYSLDYNPIEFLWRKTKKRATYNKYFKEFAAVVVSADKALAYFAAHPEMVLELLGFTVKRARSNSSRLRRFRKQT
jgi:transposase